MMLQCYDARMLFRTFPVALPFPSSWEAADRRLDCVCSTSINNLNLSKLLHPRCKMATRILGEMISDGKSLPRYLKAGQLEIAC